jgi:glycosyltransferase involved in cell wall biosynthesis
MKISCLIAAYKAGRFIAKAMESIRSQTHADWELVVVEDGSRDETEALVNAFAASVKQPVRYENLGTNRGVAVARNRLLQLARGEAVAFLDADDWWTPHHLSNAAAKFAQGADVVVGRIQLFDLDSGRALETYAPDAALFRDPLMHLFDRSAIMTSSCISLRSRLVRQAGEFDASLRIGEDRDYWMRCAALGGRFADSGEVTCFYAKHASSTMAKTLLWAQQEVAFYRKHWTLAAIPAAVRRDHLVHALLNYGRLTRATEPKLSVKTLASAWGLQPFSLSAATQLICSAVHALRTGSRHAA